MSLYFNPLDTSCKSTIGAVRRTERVTFTIYEYDENLTDEIALIIWRDGKKSERYVMKKQDSRHTITLKFNAVGLYFYYFSVGNRIFSRGRLRKGSFSETPTAWQITVHEEEYKVPSWLKGGVMYQIFPDRFNRAENNYPLAKGRKLKKWGDSPDDPKDGGAFPCHDFFGGNLKGIREKLDYLQSLHVTAIYLNPIFEASSNHRYDTADYFKIDPMLGSQEDFDELVRAARERGIRIILDGVFNHTGADSIYFNRYGNYPSVGAFQSQESPYYEWYNFHPFPTNYDCWWGIETLPSVNEMNKCFQEFMLGENGVIRYWLRRGIGGFRLDVADELPDEFLKELRKAVKEENPEAILYGEVWEDASNKISYDVRREYFQGRELDSVMNYPLKDAIIDFLRTNNTEHLRETIAMLTDNYPKQSLDTLMNILGTHDTPRILTVLKQSEFRLQPKELLKKVALLQYTMSGIPCIYYGDESGLEGEKDPFCRGCLDWEHIDKELNAFYKKLSEIRLSCKDIFAEGIYREIFADRTCLIFERNFRGKSVVIYVNCSENTYNLTFDEEYIECFTNLTVRDKFIVSPHGYGILRKN